MPAGAHNRGGPNSALAYISYPNDPVMKHSLILTQHFSMDVVGVMYLWQMLEKKQKTSDYWRPTGQLQILGLHRCKTPSDHLVSISCRRPQSITRNFFEVQRFSHHPRSSRHCRSTILIRSRSGKIMPDLIELLGKYTRLFEIVMSKKCQKRSLVLCEGRTHDLRIARLLPN